MNYLWLALMVGAVLIGGWQGHLQDVTDKSFEMTKTAVIDIAFPLIGTMALWLGVMRLAERSGMVSLLAHVMRPLMRRLFPDVPPEHPAMGSMVMNIAANMLGLGNAATPLGLRAMKDLESLNRTPGTATDAMCTFLTINTSSVQIVPVTAMAILAANHSTNPSCIAGTSLIATACACICGVTTARLLSKLPHFRLPPPSVAAGTSTAASGGTEPQKPALREAENLRPLRWWSQLILAAFFLFFAWLFIKELNAPPVPNQPVPTPWVRTINAISLLLVPFLLSIFPLYAALRGVKVYEEFVDAAKEGFEVAIKIIPYLLAMLVAIGMFRAAGGIDMIAHWLQPALALIRFPVDLLPMVLLRPFSGSGTLGMFTELTQHFGADSLIARTAGTIYGSTETTFYVLVVYFGAVAVRRARYAVISGLTADFVSVVASVVLCRIVFG